ncbi:hypothetical protein BYI23_F000250 (plasmid) [Burkholderia sp. YI23]|nr:hypothetical protein BYI23_F000250 [Burkholderia sp. YI23]
MLRVRGVIQSSHVFRTCALWMEDTDDTAHRGRSLSLMVYKHFRISTPSRKERRSLDNSRRLWRRQDDRADNVLHDRPREHSPVVSEATIKRCPLVRAQVAIGGSQELPRSAGNTEPNIDQASQMRSHPDVRARMTLESKRIQQQEASTREGGFRRP